MINQYKELQETRQVQNYGLAEWLKDVQAAIYDGYEFDFETNSAYPQAIGHVFTCTMKLRKPVLNTLPQMLQETEPVLAFPPIEEPVIENLLPDKQAELFTVLPSGETEDADAPLFQDEEPVVTPEVDQPVKRGPKPKNK